MELLEARRQWLSTPHSWASAGHLATSWSVYAVLAVAALHFPLALQLPIWVAMAWLLLGNGAVVHECTHRHLFRSASLNRWVGSIAGMSVMLPFGVYRAYHLDHHRYTVAIEDPEGPPLRFRSRFEYPLLGLGGIAFLARLIGYGTATAAGRPPSWLRSRRSRHAAVTDTFLCVGALGAATVAIISDPSSVVTVWLVPWLITITVLVPLVLVTEHYGAEVGTVEAADSTRTVLSNRALRWVYWNNNFHTAHHELPSVVHQSLPELEHIAAGRRHEMWSSSGYLAFHHQVWASLPWSARSPRAGSTTTGS